MLLTRRGLPYSGSGTWANRPSPIPANGTFYFATDVGENGTLLQSNGTRWRALNGRTTLKTLAAPVSGIAAAEQIVLQTLLPIGAWQNRDSLIIQLDTTKSGVTDTGLLTIRVGTLGTTGDTAITGFSSFQFMTAGGVAGGGTYEICLNSATSAQKMGANTNGQSSHSSPAGSATGATATTITDASANALHVSVGLLSGGATNTVAALAGSISLITP
jgi:hypothetical protein